MPLMSRAVFLPGAALILLANPAAAIEPEAAAAALAAALAKGSDSKAAYESAVAESGNVVIKGLTISRGADEPTIAFGETIIEAPADSVNGVFESPRITFTNGTIAGASTGSIASAALTGATVLDPETMKGDGFGESILFETAEANDFRATRSAEEPGEISVKRVFIESGNVVDNIAQDSKGVVEGIVLPPEIFAESSMKLETLGYEELVIDVTWDGSRDVAGGTMELRDLNVSIEGGGDLSIAATMGNLPDPRMLNDPNATDAASKLKVHRASIRYDDDSLAERILDYRAGQQGISRAEYAEQVSAALPFLLAILNNPGFQKEVSEAVAAFLADPQSLTITIAPDEPVSGEEILGLIGTAPQTIPDRLKASIQANSPE